MHARSNRQNAQRTVPHPVKVHVRECFCKQRFGTLHVFTHGLNVQKMNIIYQCLLKCAQSLFGSDNSSWILQADNDPKH